MEVGRRVSSGSYPKASKYDDLDEIYAQCSGPGGLQLAEFLADRLHLDHRMRVLDIGCNRGYQSCFLAREYSAQVVAIDPWDDREDGRPVVEHVRDNAEKWGVLDSVLPLKLAVPETPFTSNSFDAVYTSTALEMVRGVSGEAAYARCLEEIRRLLRPGGVLALAEPMHRDIEIPAELTPLVSQKFGWKACFRSLQHTIDVVSAAGFEILESGHAPDADTWWHEYALHDPFCKAKPEEDPRALKVDAGRWVSLGYVIARGPG